MVILIEHDDPLREILHTPWAPQVADGWGWNELVKNCAPSGQSE